MSKLHGFHNSQSSTPQALEINQGLNNIIMMWR
jgi:hypothetical protein